MRATLGIPGVQLAKEQIEYEYERSLQDLDARFLAAPAVAIDGPLVSRSPDCLQVSLSNFCNWRRFYRSVHVVIDARARTDVLKG